MLEVCVIIPSAATGEVALSAVPLSLAGEDGLGLQPIGVGSKRCEENNSYLKHPGSPALGLTAREMTPERFGDAGKPGERVGSLEPGKQMDAVLVRGPAIDLFRVGADTIRAVVKRGRVVVDKGEDGENG